MSAATSKKTFSLRDIEAGHFKVTYKGVPALKCPFDYVLYQMIITAVKPELIIEIGTNQGGSSLYMADLLELNKKGELHTIDIRTNQEHFLLQSHPRIRIFRDGFAAYDTRQLDLYDSVLVVEDGSHQYQDSLAALRKFTPFVSKGSYYIVEDGIVNDLGREKEFNGGPLKAIREFLKDNRHFAIDRGLCDLFGHNTTFNVDGYLKRIS
jgi:cephalosporin hydroxylase